MSDKNKRSEFIVNFLETILDLSKGFAQAFNRESLHYKDMRAGGYDPKQIYNNLSNLKHRGILKLSGRGRFALTSAGKKWAKRSVHKYFKLRNRRWDKKWRVIIFDVPQELHNVRTKFRRKLRSLGFYMLQKSVFVFPYDCEEELGYIAADFKISDYIDVIIADKIGYKEKELLKYYNL